MIIRKATIRDAKEIAELYLEIWKAHSSLGDFWLPTWAPKSVKRFGDLVNAKGIQKKLYKDAINTIKDKHTTFFVAEEEKEVAGYIEFYIEENRDWFKVKKYGLLDEVCVSPAYRRKGIAKNLLAFAENYLKKRGIKYILLKTSLKNEIAQKTWESQGFEKEVVLWSKKIK